MTSSSSSSPEISAATSADPEGRFSYKHATHDEVLDDLSSRFILNLPDEELASLERICFQVEQAHWFYEDFIREENPKFPSLPLKKFSAMLFHACPLLHQWSHDHEQAFNNFMQYKTRVPVCGAIMLNATWEKCVLVKGWKSSSGWGFPKGKINEDEPEPNCAIREVLEETGYNLAGQINPEDVIEMSIKEQKISLYIVPGVPEDYPFETKTRKEISKIEWFKLTDLPTWKRNKAAPGRFYLISPFIGALKTFISERKPRHGTRKPPRIQTAPPVRTSPAPPVDHRDVCATDSDITNDTAQESSSQSSSADNGDPQTPSPHYTASVARVADENLDSGIIDPHFARLLTSLTLSATAAVEPKASLQSTHTTLSITHLEQTRKEASTPVPVTIPSSAYQSTTGRTTHADWSTSVPRRLSDRHSQLSLSSDTTEQPSSKTMLPSVPTVSSPPSAQPPKPPASLLSESRSTSRQEHHHLAHPHVSESLLPSVTSPRPRYMSSRRSSSTADISPYLTRTTEVPTSAKRLKQLALLESVADESARMTPFLGHREAFTGHSILPDRRDSSMLLPPPSHQTVTDNSNDLRVIYSSGPASGGPPTLLPLPTAPHPSFVHDDPFQVRPRTSQALHRGPLYPQSSSMGQNQLLALMNGPRATPAPNNAPYTHPYSIQAQYSQPLHQVPYVPDSYHPYPLRPQQGPPPLPAYHPHMYPQTPATLPPYAPTPSSLGYNLQPPIQPLASSNSQLLSILNGNKAAPTSTLTLR